MSSKINIENSKAINQIGSGTFGKIFLCRDNTGKEFISKQVNDESCFIKEIKMYNMLENETDYFPKFYSYFFGKFKKCIFLENCQEDLRSILMRKENICQEMFVFHTSKALKILKEKDIIHCDLKPENILYDSRSDLFKICDFGISCFNSSNKKFFPVQTVYYRSPEVIIKKLYDFTIDIWSLGCIIYEIMHGKILFHSMKEEECFFEMISRIGTPPDDIYNNFYKKNIENLSYDHIKNYNNLPGLRIEGEKLKVNISREDRIITKCLRWRPEDRIKPEEIVRMYENTKIESNHTI